MMWLDWAERWVGALGLLSISVALAAIFLGLYQSLRRASGRVSGSPGRMMNWGFYIVGGTLYFGICIILWRPLPLSLPVWGRVLSLTLGSVILFPGLAFIIWGRLTLGRMYNVSSGFGVRLYEDQRLVTDGPFAVVRHPMYLGILLLALGGILVYRVWTLVFLLGNIPGLMRRARLEEETLAAELGEAWEEYRGRVPAWIPRIPPLWRDDE